MDKENIKQIPSPYLSRMPKIAIIDPNTLAVLGMRQLLQQVMPIMKAVHFASFEEMENSGEKGFVHYFVATNVVISNRQFFLEHRQQTFVLTNSNNPNTQLSGFHCLCTNVPENQLIKNLLKLEQYGHPHGKNLPAMPHAHKVKALSDREIEVLALVAQGMINKKIADQLNIGLTTVITHRKNIQEKLGVKSVSALTIYAVMHGYVDINSI